MSVDITAVGLQQLPSVTVSCIACRFVVATSFNEVLMGVAEALCSTDCCHVVMTVLCDLALLSATEENHKIIVRGAVPTRDFTNASHECCY